jgi:hypothetical protein
MVGHILRLPIQLDNPTTYLPNTPANTFAAGPNGSPRDEVRSYLKNGLFPSELPRELSVAKFVRSIFSPWQFTVVC